MDYGRLKDRLNSIGCVFRENEPMKAHTSFKIGGPADIFIEPSSEQMVKEIVDICKESELPFFILGNGSNLLVSDLGIEGVVIHISGGLSEITLSGPNEIECGAGNKLSVLCSFALENSLSGLQFAWGIPGSVGGAVFMNAGAYGSEMSSVVSECRTISTDGSCCFYEIQDMNFGYRTSKFKRSKEIITSVKFKLCPGEKPLIRDEMDELMCRRKNKQPLEYPSAGSVFKRPQGNFAGTLIERCGLKGYSIGGAAVSEKHAGFIVNLGEATCSDVKRLIDEIERRVFLETSIRLEPEIEMVGR